MIERVGGMKVLLLDGETTGIVSMVFSQSQILEREVFLVERLDAENKEKMRHLNAVCFFRPTADNFLRLAKELKAPSYAEYHLFFSNVAPHSQLERLARCDEYDSVQQVHEYFADLYAINHDLFSLNLAGTVGLTQDPTAWTNFEEAVFERTVEGIFAALLALRRRPLVRYLKPSELCRRVATKLQQRMTEDHSLFDSMGVGLRAGGAGDYSAGGGGCVLLLVDRREDPVTPLLNQWTYQAMLHELIGIENNRVDMRKAPGIAEDLKEIVMSPAQDNFLEQNLSSNFGDLGVAIKRYVEAYQQQTQNTAKIESIEDMQRFVDQFPEFRKLSGNVSKHVAVVHELSRLVETNDLLDVSCLEQDLACTNNRNEHCKAVLDRLRSPDTRNMERLRLVLLYALRYENDTYIGQLKEELKKAGIEEEQVALVDALLAHAGSHVRSGDLFQNKNFLAVAKSSIQRGFKGVPNVYTQHKSLLATTLELLLKGKLKETQYPFVPTTHSTASGAASRDKPSEVIVFVVGGATFEEARDVAHLNAQGGCRIILGGTTVHNTKSFLADISQLVRGRRVSTSLDFGGASSSSSSAAAASGPLGAGALV
ncbi:unnamed protein product [Vitrella brassicaformis CCMP3155]|uniref:Vacuolar protein sorting-associated protein 45 n=2 Tax=Vitrella brassicaformis TaxID=1169539 RepID=A0A0G4G961_VITBC|nr:unnamed protein product [Vitrella brassicaformis CCMP3155]|eukprot:CEM25368.1 unnamed protein product [Vitrella brassicaformis CCMP3155]